MRGDESMSIIITRNDSILLLLIIFVNNVINLLQHFLCRFDRFTRVILRLEDQLMHVEVSRNDVILLRKFRSRSRSRRMSGITGVEGWQMVGSGVGFGPV